MQTQQNALAQHIDQWVDFGNLKCKARTYLDITETLLFIFAIGNTLFGAEINYSIAACVSACVLEFVYRATLLSEDATPSKAINGIN